MTEILNSIFDLIEGPEYHILDYFEKYKLNPKLAFKYSNLNGIDFSNKNLSQFDFSNSSLEETNFIDSEIYLANFRFSNVTGEQLRTAQDFFYCIPPNEAAVANLFGELVDFYAYVSKDFHNDIKKEYIKNIITHSIVTHGVNFAAIMVNYHPFHYEFIISDKLIKWNYGNEDRKRTVETVKFSFNFWISPEHTANAIEYLINILKNNKNYIESRKRINNRRAEYAIRY